MTKQQSKTTQLQTNMTRLKQYKTKHQQITNNTTIQKQYKTNNTIVSTQQEQLNQNSKFKQNYKISSNCDALGPLDKTNKTTRKLTKRSNKTKLDKQALGEGHECDIKGTKNEINVATKLVTPHNITAINRMKHDYEQPGKQNQYNGNNTMSVCACTEEDPKIGRNQSTARG